jgi:hypothetical protein
MAIGVVTASAGFEIQQPTSDGSVTHPPRGVVFELVQATLATTVTDGLPLGFGQISESLVLPEARALFHCVNRADEGTLVTGANVLPQ